MSIRTLSASAVRELFAQHSGAVLLACVTFDHPTMDTPARVVNNAEDITFDGHLYRGLPFELSLPDDVEDRVPNLEIRIDNVERTLIELLRTVVSELPSVVIDIVRVQDGIVTREIGPLSFSLIGHEITVDSVTLTVGHAIDILNEPATQEIFNPGLAPGLFA